MNNPIKDNKFEGYFPMQPLYTMPVPPSDNSPDFLYHQAFVHAMNRIEHPSIALKLRQAIEETATKTQTSPAHIARLLVDYGMRAPRHAFPDSFLDYIDSRPEPKLSVLRAAQDIDVLELKNFWQALRPQVIEERLLENA